MRTLFVRFAISVGAATVATMSLGCRTSSPESTPAPETSSAPAANVDGAPSAAASSPAAFPIPRASVDLVLDPEDARFPVLVARPRRVERIAEQIRALAKKWSRKPGAKPARRS